MAEKVTLLNPKLLVRNRDNPRLIFRESDLESLQQSIAKQGILVPLTVFRDGSQYRLLDGERRWRSAIKLGLQQIPVIVQPKPQRLQNIMMMFAIHHARRDWDPLPTALKLRDLEDEYERINGRKPNEIELAGLASQSRGEIRRLKKLLNLPENYRQELLEELSKPRSEQVLTVDQVLEVTTAAGHLRKQGVVDTRKEERLRRALIDKFRRKRINNTVDPRLLSKLARAVDRKEVPLRRAKAVVDKLIGSAGYTIEEAFRDSVEQIDFQHGLRQVAARLASMIEVFESRGYDVSPSLSEVLKLLAKKIQLVTRS